MDLSQLKLNRYLQKEPSQADQTKDAIYNSVNPLQKKGDKDGEKRGGTENNKEDNGAENILTGTVITACLIQTSGLPSRIELEGNDLTFYDDTILKGKKVIGDTARLVFTHDQNSGEGFIMEKRASTLDTYDNVLSWYASPAKDGRNNYLYIGREGRFANTHLSNLSYLEFTVNNSSSYASQPNANGLISFAISSDGVLQPGGMNIGHVDAAVPGDTGVYVTINGTGDGTARDQGGVAISYIGTSTYTLYVGKNGIQMFGLPTSSAGLVSGTVWRNGTVLNIVT